MVELRKLAVIKVEQPLICSFLEEQFSFFIELDFWSADANDSVFSRQNRPKFDPCLQIPSACRMDQTANAISSARLCLVRQVLYRRSNDAAIRIRKEFSHELRKHDENVGSRNEDGGL